MQVKILNESGYNEALLGLSLSYNRDVSEMPQVATKLYWRGDEEAKFLRQICVWLDVTAPRYWWCQMDTYSVGKEQQSESTMHTITKRPLNQDDFARDVNPTVLVELNYHIGRGDMQRVKAWLPEGFLQRRILCTNYQTLRRIVRQRRKHKLPEWQVFINSVLEQALHKEFFDDLETT